MARLIFSDNGFSPFERILGHNPGILQKWGELEAAFFESKTFAPDLLEQVRRTLAYGNGCEYCMAKAGLPDDAQSTLRASMAVAIAQRVVENHRDFTDADFSTFKQVFSEAELSELFAFICFICASQMFGASLRLMPWQTYESTSPCQKHTD